MIIQVYYYYYSIHTIYTYLSGCFISCFIHCFITRFIADWVDHSLAKFPDIIREKYMVSVQ